MGHKPVVGRGLGPSVGCGERGVHVAYPEIPKFEKLTEQIRLYAQLKHECGAARTGNVLKQVEQQLKVALSTVKNLPEDKLLAMREPNTLAGIRKVRPPGPRRFLKALDGAVYREKVEGALLGRMAGCTLGAIVEGWAVKRMADWAEEIGDAFPPVDYWSETTEPDKLRYLLSPRSAYTRSRMRGVPVDDDIAYTLLGLLVAEEYGTGFSVAQMGAAWLKYLPIAYTAERVALENLGKGIPAERVAEKNNPYVQWIGADIRADPWGYMAPGWPEYAAEMAYRDAYLSHRRNGLYGAMYFAAAISAAFVAADSVEALKVGLSEIPQGCLLARDLRWALRLGKDLKNYKDARDAVDRRFKGMSPVHTNNNACLTVFGLMIGGTDFTKVISETVAMGLDNDCTAATAGSIAGAVLGVKGIPSHWTRRFNNTVHSYLKGRKTFHIDNLVTRFERQARKAHKINSG